MKSNSILTWALYLLLAGLVAVFGYRACQLKKEKAAKEADQLEMERTLRDMGYQSDTAETSGVAKPSNLGDTKPMAKTDGSATAAKPSASTTSTTTAPKPVTSSTPTTAKPEPAAKSKFVDKNDENFIGPLPEKKATTSKTAASSSASSKIASKTAGKKAAVAAKPTTSAKGATAAKAAKSGKPAFAVIAASFASKPNARKVMEALVKKGYENAEVSTKGKYFVVISERSNNKDEAAKMAEKVRKEPDCAKAYVYKRP